MLKRIKRRARRALADLKYNSPLGRNGIRPRAGGRILLYHGVDAKGSTAFNTRFTSRHSLERQFAWLKKWAHVVPLDAFFEEHRESDALTITITFDDGYRNNREVALPLLEKYELPATFFITAAEAAGEDILWPDHVDLATPFGPSRIEILGETFVKGRKEYRHADTGRSLKQRIKEGGPEWRKAAMQVLPDDFRKRPELGPYWQRLREADIRHLAGHGLVTLGTHGLLHDNLDLLSMEAASEDLRQSKAWLENITQGPVEALSYPDGAYTRTLIDEAERLGYRRQLAVDYHYPADREDPRIRARMGANPFISANQQIACFNRGHY